MILVGNKCDMEDERVISFERGKQLADSLGLEFYETSAKENINVRVSISPKPKQEGNGPMDLRRQGKLSRHIPSPQVGYMVPIASNTSLTWVVCIGCGKGRVDIKLGYSTYQWGSSQQGSTATRT